MRVIAELHPRDCSVNMAQSQEPTNRNSTFLHPPSISSCIVLGHLTTKRAGHCKKSESEEPSSPRSSYCHSLMETPTSNVPRTQGRRNAAISTASSCRPPYWKLRSPKVVRGPRIPHLSRHTMATRLRLRSRVINSLASNNDFFSPQMLSETLQWHQIRFRHPMLTSPFLRGLEVNSLSITLTAL